MRGAKTMEKHLADIEMAIRAAITESRREDMFDPDNVYREFRAYLKQMLEQVALLERSWSLLEHNGIYRPTVEVNYQLDTEE
jgi:hypothetical protein